jgi:hypothetical protein
MKKEEYRKHNLKTMSKEYIIYEREIQKVQNRLQDVHDYKETRRQMGGGIQRNTLTLFLLTWRKW